MMTKAFFPKVAVFAGLLMATTPGSGQTEQQGDASETGADIVVTGEVEISARKVHRQARRITPQTDIRSNPLARFQKPVCPGVSGLPLEAAELMVERIRYNAERIGLELDEAGSCVPNILVAFVEDGATAIDAISKDRRSWLTGLDYYEKKKVLADPGPARVWNIKSMRSRTGALMGLFTTNPADFSATRLYINIRHDIELSVVVIDYTAALGLNVIQLADYASMRSLARTKPPEGGSNYGTILSLFDDPDRAPPGLTDFDLAYLNSVNSSLANLPGATKIAGVYGKMRREAGEEAAN